MLLKPKGSIGRAFPVRIRTENHDQARFCPFYLREVSVLTELALGHLRYHSSPDSALGSNRLSKREVSSNALAVQTRKLCK